LEKPWFDPNVDKVLSKPEPFDEATAVCTAPAISGWIAARICATSEEVDNEEEDEEEAEDEEDEEEKDDEELDEEEEIIWIALFTWLSQISCEIPRNSAETRLCPWLDAASTASSRITPPSRAWPLLSPLQSLKYPATHESFG